MMTRTLDRLAEEAEKLLRGMIKIPALSFEEREKSDFIYGRLAGMCNPKIIRTGCNIVLLPAAADKAKKTLMLCAHMDTVAPAGSYTTDPYGAIDAGDRIIGLGSNDDGASLVCMTAAFLNLCYGFCGSGTETEACSPNLSPNLGPNLSPNLNIILVLAAEEEKSGRNGMKAVLGELSKYENGKYYPDFAIVGEPTGMKAAVAERGLIVLDGTAVGKSGHAAREEGINALYIAMDDIAALRRARFRRKSKYMGDIKVTVTQINGGTAHNVVPDRCTFVVDIRPNECYTNEEIVAALQRRVKSTLTPRSLDHRVSVTPYGHPLMKCVDRLGIEKYESPTTSDWTRIPVPAVKMGPGDSARSHRADEYILKSEIREGIEKYIAFLKALQEICL